MSKVIAVTGAPHAGKTTISLQLARAMQKDLRKVVVVFCDTNLPPKAYLCKPDDSTSLGTLLTAVTLDTEDVLKGITAVNEWGILGYKAGETVQDFPLVTRTGAQRFVETIASAADVVIFDFGDKPEDVLQKIVLEQAQVVEVLNADAQSAAWLKAQKTQPQVIVLNAIDEGQPLDEFPADIRFSFVGSVYYNEQTGKAFVPVKDKDYQKSLAQLVDVLESKE